MVALRTGVSTFGVAHSGGASLPSVLPPKERGDPPDKQEGATPKGGKRAWSGSRRLPKSHVAGVQLPAGPSTTPARYEMWMPVARCVVNAERFRIAGLCVSCPVPTFPPSLTLRVPCWATR